MEETLKEILQELKWHTKQNDKITELLGRMRQPCGGSNKADIAGMMNLLKTMADTSKNPAMSKVIEQAEEMVKKAAG